MGANLTALYYAAGAAALASVAWAKVLLQDANLPPMMPETRWLANALILNLFLVFALLGGRAHSRKETARYVLAWLVSALVLCWVKPVFSGDLIGFYLIRGRMWVVHHLNPYLYTPTVLRQDLLIPYSEAWRDMTNSYGPVGFLFQAIPVWLAPNHVKGMVFVFKFMAVLATLGSAWMLRRLYPWVWREPEKGQSLLFLLSPLTVVFTLLDGHNDAFMVFFLITAVLAASRSRWTLCFLAWTAAFLVKYTAVMALPVLGVFAYRNQTGSFWSRWMRVLGWALASFAGMAAAFSPFWKGSRIFAIFGQYQDWFYTNSIPYAVHSIFCRAGACFDPNATAAAFRIAGGLIYGGLIVYLWRRPNPRVLMIALFGSLGLFYVVLPGALQGWYFLWAWPWLLLAFREVRMSLLLVYSIPPVFSYFKRINYLFLLALAVWMSWECARWVYAKVKR